MGLRQKQRPRIDWKTERERIDLAAVATRLLGPASGRRGQGGRKLWWCCPFHEDKNPSFCIEPGNPWWKCFGCGLSGDAANLVMRLEGLSFPETVGFLTEGSSPSGKAPTRPGKAPSAKPPPEPSGLPEADALALVEAATLALWAREKDQTADPFLSESLEKRSDGEAPPLLSESGEELPDGQRTPFLSESREHRRINDPSSVRTSPLLSESGEKCPGRTPDLFLGESAENPPDAGPTSLLSESAGKAPDGWATPLLSKSREHRHINDSSGERVSSFLSENGEKLSDSRSARESADALAYLTGPDRGLSLTTIKAARIGWTPRADGVAWKPSGIVIPWFVGDRLALVKVRPPEAWRERYRRRFPDRKQPPKYIEAFRDPRRLVCYPDPATIRPGRPLIVVEGEFDALALGEALGDMASVVTLGSASSELAPAIVARFLTASPWYIATDSDEAGDKSAAKWNAYPRARRVRPPSPHKDWTEARQAGVDLARWWRDMLTGRSLRPDARGDLAPELFTDEEAASWRW